MTAQEALKIRRAYENIRNNYVGWRDNVNFEVLEKALAALATVNSEPQPVACGGRENCSRFPFCGCGAEPAFPERDASKPAEQQGLFRKFDVRRVDGSDQPGGKHCGCRHYVLDLDHDKYAPAAMRAYATACKETHPNLAADIESEFAACPAPDVRPSVSDEAVHLIYFDDRDRAPEVIIGSDAAQARFNRVSDQWNAHLFVKVKSNSSDDPYYSANAAPSVPVSDEQIIDKMARAGFIYVHVLDAVNKHFVGSVKDARSILSTEPAAPVQQEPFGTYIERSDGVSEFRRTGDAFSPSPLSYTAWTLYTAPAVQQEPVATQPQDKWHEAVLAECMRTESCYVEADPVKTNLPRHYMDGVENGGYFLITDVIRSMSLAQAAPAVPDAWRESLALTMERLNDDAEMYDRSGHNSTAEDRRARAYELSQMIAAAPQPQPTPSIPADQLAMALCLLGAVETVCMQSGTDVAEMVEWLDSDGGLVKLILAAPRGLLLCKDDAAIAAQSKGGAA